jgi:uncharacterized membrane protein
MFQKGGVFMDFRDRDSLINEAKERLARTSTDHKKLVLIYAGAMTAVLAVLTVAVNLLQSRIADTGGLSGIGMRSVLETAISVLEIGGNLAMPFWTFGYLFCMLGVVRGFHMKPERLLAGFRRFGPVLRLNLYRGVRYGLLAILSVYPSVLLFLVSPLGEPVNRLLMPIAQPGMDTAQMLEAMDPATFQAISDAMMPAMGFYAVVFLLLAAPVFYQLRMADFFLMDDPKMGAMMAVRKSTVLMHRKRMEMFKLDLRFWWYYGLQALALLVCYAPMILGMLGITVPQGVDLGCYGVYLAMQFGIIVLARNRVEVTVALAYEALLHPQPEQPKKAPNVPWKW